MLNDNRDRVKRYKRHLERLSYLLYDADPYEYGSSVFAPEDEYAPVAERLMVDLSRIESRADYIIVLRRHHIEDSLLADRIWEVLQGP
jgi:hypothetical protein